MNHYIIQCSKLLIVASIFFLTSCGSKSDMSNPTEKFGIQSYYTVLEQGGMSNYEEPAVKVIKSLAQLQEVYSVINRTRRPGLPVPDVDFKKVTVIAAFAGTKSNGGYSIEVKQIEDTDEFRDISFSVETPEPGTPVTMAITTPFMIISTPNDDKKITASF